MELKSLQVIKSIKFASSRVVAFAPLFLRAYQLVQLTYINLQQK